MKRIIPSWKLSTSSGSSKSIIPFHASVWPLLSPTPRSYSSVSVTRKPQEYTIRRRARHTGASPPREPQEYTTCCLRRPSPRGSEWESDMSVWRAGQDGVSSSPGSGNVRLYSSQGSKRDVIHHLDEFSSVPSVLSVPSVRSCGYKPVPCVYAYSYSGYLILERQSTTS